MDLITAKKAAIPAERHAESLVTIPVHHLFPGISGYDLGGPVEIEDPPLEIVSDDSFPQAVQDIGEVVNLLPNAFPFTLRGYLGNLCGDPGNPSFHF